MHVNGDVYKTVELERMPGLRSHEQGMKAQARAAGYVNYALTVWEIVMDYEGLHPCGI